MVLGLGCLYGLKLDHTGFGWMRPDIISLMWKCGWLKLGGYGPSPSTRCCRMDGVAWFMGLFKMEVLVTFAGFLFSKDELLIR